MNAQHARDDDTAPVTLAPRCPACKSGCVVDLGGAHAGIRCMVERNGRRARMPARPETDYLTLAPDRACEVLSGETRNLDLLAKRPVCAREGVGRLWLVEPTDRTLEALELREREWVLIAAAKDDGPVSVRAFDAVTFTLGDLWP